MAATKHSLVIIGNSNEPLGVRHGAICQVVCGAQVHARVAYTLAETARLGSAEVSLRFRDVQLALDGSDVSEYDAGLAGPTVQARGCALKRRLDARCSSWSLLCDRHEGARRGVIAEVLSGGRYAYRPAAHACTRAMRYP